MTTRVDMAHFDSDSPYSTLHLETDQGEFELNQHNGKSEYSVYFYDDSDMQWLHIEDTTSLSDAVITVECFDYDGFMNDRGECGMNGADECPRGMSELIDCHTSIDGW